MGDVLQGMATLLDPRLILYMTAAIAFAQVVAAIPGLGGSFTLAILIPFTYTMPPTLGIAALVGAAATSAVANNVTSILFGVPGSPTGVATTFDGHPMARKGLAGRAIGASMGASTIGAIVGAIGLAALLPALQRVVLLIGPAAIFVVIIFALYALAYVGQGTLGKGLVSGGLGLMLAFVGQEHSTGALRYTMGSLYLWDGLKLVPVMIGLFAITEMLRLIRRGGAISSEQPGRITAGSLQGLMDSVRYWKATLRSSLVGLVVGIIPGLGGDAAQFIGYAQVARTSKERETFGKGNVQGVIASDASTNAKEGGALVPTLALGIPGSSSMALLLAAFVTFGLQPGPKMLEGRLYIFWMIVGILVVSHIIAVAMVLAGGRLLASLTRLPVALIVAPIMAVSIFGAYTASQNLGDIWVMLGMGVLGYFMTVSGYSRAALIIGFILGPLLEHNFLLALQLYGPGFLARPIPLGLLSAMALGVAWSLSKTRLKALIANRRNLSNATRE